jgi:hypothetical protein
MKGIILPILVMTKESAELKSLGVDTEIDTKSSEEMVFYNINAIAKSGMDVEMTEIWVNGKILYCPLPLNTVRKRIEEIEKI